MKIIFCIPGKIYSNKFFVSWTRTLIDFFHRGIDFDFVNEYSSNVYFARNLCLGGNNLRGKNQLPWQGNIDYDYMMWIDSDIIWSPDQVLRLIAISERYDEVKIVSGLYIMENKTEYATVINWNIEHFKKYGRFKFLTKNELKSYKLDNLFEVAYTGFGFMLLKKGVFETIGYPWFQPLWEEAELINGTTVRDFTSEDVGFCRIATENGFHIYVDPNTIVGHEKSYVLY